MDRALIQTKRPTTAGNLYGRDGAVLQNNHTDADYAFDRAAAEARLTELMSAIT